jgi:hypothetical protein
MEGLEEDVLDGERVLLADVELAAASGLAHMDPVGGATRLIPGEGLRSGALWPG